MIEQCARRKPLAGASLFRGRCNAVSDASGRLRKALHGETIHQEAGMASRVTITGSLSRPISNSKAARQVPFANALALTWTAKDIQKNTVKMLQRKLDSPKPYTLRSVAIKPATKAKPRAEVFFKEFAGKGVAAGKYLRHMETGGQRAPKRFELALQRAGILPQGSYVVPADGGSVDLAMVAGRNSGGIYARILSALRASPDPLQNAAIRSDAAKRRKGQRIKRGRRAARYWVQWDREQNFPTAIWERVSAKVARPVLIVVSRARYRDELDFREDAAKTFAARYPINMRRAWAMALATAR